MFGIHFRFWGGPYWAASLLFFLHNCVGANSHLSSMSEVSKWNTFSLLPSFCFTKGRDCLTMNGLWFFSKAAVAVLFNTTCLFKELLLVVVFFFLFWLLCLWELFVQSDCIFYLSSFFFRPPPSLPPLSLFTIVSSGISYISSGFRAKRELMLEAYISLWKFL